MARLEELKADYRAVTGREWSELRGEGPVLLTSNTVRGSEILLDLKERLKELRSSGVLR